MLKIAYDIIYRHPLEKNHRFPMEKYDLIPIQLIKENTCNSNNFFVPKNLKDQDVLNTHEKNYYERLSSLSLTKKEVRPIGFPMSKKLVLREKKIAQGTIECSNFSLINGISMNIAGGTHHAFYDRGEGFCMLNDQAIAANYLINNGLAKKILIIDLDVHQGNGTASIFKDNPNVFTLSFHGHKNYPFKKEKSDLDFGFNDFTNDDFYLKKLKEIIPKVIDNFQPDFIFYLSGVDVLENDKLGRLSLSIKGCLERDSFILNNCKKNNIPVQVSMGGGYSFNIEEIIEAHSNTFRLAQEIYF
ncbi:MAG: histone deacetylase [Flavobacteriaceae bacterium]|nr:histone deacetylase [Flavobacteriaceae bacterium]